MNNGDQNYYTAIALAASLLGIVVIYFIITLIRQQRRNLRLQKSQILAEITTLENERKRISSDLHDEIGPILSAIKLQITSLEPAHPEDVLIVEKSSRQIDDVIKKMRAIAYNLLPNTLVRKGLAAALNEYVSRMNEVFPLKIKLNTNEIVLENQEKEINIYRIVQEIVHNTTKHARATELSIDMKIENGKFVMTTQDNGIGFNYQDAAREQGGLGLRNLESRTEVMGGEMTCDSQKQKGTTYIFEIPV